MKKNGGKAKEFFIKLRHIYSRLIATETKSEGYSTDNGIPRIKRTGRPTSSKAVLQGRLVIKGFMLAFLFTVVILAGLVWYTWRSNRHLKMLETTHFRLLRLSGRIIHIDEVLTMSAHMAVETGEPEWEERYRSFEPQLDSAIKEVIGLSPEQFMKEAISRTDTANIKLVAMENRAFDLIRQGQLETARKILHSPEYKKQKQIYSSGIYEISNAISIRERTRIKKEQRIALTIAVLLIGTIPLVAFIWFTAMRILRRYIFERKQAEFALRMGEQRFRAIADYTYFWEVWVSPGGNPIWTNPAVERVTGYSADELMGMRDYPMALVYEDDREKVDKAFKSALKGSTGRGMEFRLLRKDGSIIWVETAWQPIFDAKGVSQGHRVSIHDIMDRKQAEQSLHASEEKFRLMFETSPLGMVLCEMDGTFVQPNRAYLDIIGYSHEEAMKLSYWDVTPRDYDADEAEQLRAMKETGRYGPYEKEYIRKTGQRVPVLLNGMVVKGADGVERIWSIVEDITNRKQAEEALLESEQRFRDFFENAPIGFHIFGPDQIIIDINDAELEMIGYSRKAIVGKKTWAELIVPQQRDMFKKHWHNITTKGHVRNLEYTLVHKDGHHINVILNASARFDNDGNIVNTRGSVLNITARKKADDQLRQSEERYRTLVENIDLGITLVDADHNIIMASSTVGKLFDCDASELIGRKCYNKFEKRQEVCPHCPGDNAMKTGQPEEVETGGVRDDGSHFSVRIQAFPLFAADGEPTGFIEVVEDITERKTTERTLQMIVEGSSAAVGPQFFRSLVKSLSFALGVKYAFVGELTSKQPRSVQTLAVWADNDFADNFEYNLAGTPCENVVARKVCFHTANAAERFPQDILLKELGVESYFGVSLFDAFEQPLGLLTVMHSEPVEDVSKIESILKIFATRASAELERIRAELKVANLAKFPAENPNPVLRISGDTTVLYNNKAASELLDISQCQEADLMLKHLHKYAPKALKLSELLQTEMECCGKAYSLTFAPVVDSDYVNVYGLDITSRKQAERMLQDSEEQYRVLFEQAADSIALIDAETGEMVRFNNMAHETLGYTRDEFAKLRISDFEAIETANETAAHIQKIIREGSDTFETKHRTKGGVVRNILVSSRSVHLGNKAFVQSLWRDITDRKQAEAALAKLNKELAAKNKELESILYAASHDLKSPLVNIQGFGYELSQSCELIRSALTSKGKDADMKKAVDVTLNEDIPNALDFIVASTTKMDSLLSGLLDLSRLDTVATNVKAIDMKAMMADVAVSMEYQIKEAAAKVDVDPLPPCVGDPSQINRVFSNLLTNALKFLDESRPGQIRIYGKSQDNRSIYCVEDNGIGIAPEHQEKIFQIFYQDEPDKRKGEGIGLTIVRRIIEKHDGKVWVNSELGKGSKFFVSLPSASLIAVHPPKRQKYDKTS
ncbi:MAG: PAS domain S-box protein [Planctomycetota bacterium]|jgi:PAS domain S-box-containing protein